MKNRLLLRAFSKTVVLALLATLFGGMNAYAQSGYGDFIFLETFGQPGDGEDSEYYSAAQNRINNSDPGVEITFRKTHLEGMQSLWFYYPSNPPEEYGVWAFTPQEILDHHNNVGPKFLGSPHNKGSYSVATNSRGYKDEYFVPGKDHTGELAGGAHGYMLIVDAYNTTEQYFERQIDGLCAGARFEFSAWIKDINTKGASKPQLRFEIHSVNASGDAFGQDLLNGEGLTNADIEPNQWEEQKFSFVMPEGTGSIRLRIINAVKESNGNDIAIDDIGFRPMGPAVDFQMTPESPVCVGAPVEFTAHVTDATQSYITNYFQLQKRKVGESDGAWEAVGTHQTSSGTNPVTFSIGSATLEDDDHEYRIIVAGDPTTLDTEKCRAVSNALTLRVRNHQPEFDLPEDAITICAGTSTTLTTSIANGEAGFPYVYQWEQSTDMNTWTTVQGQTGSSLNTGTLTETTHYRVTATADGCVGAGVSSVLTVTVDEAPAAPVSSGDITVCAESPIQTLNANSAITVAQGTTVVWYDAETGGNVVENPTRNALGTVTYWAEAVNSTTGCVSAERTSVTLTIENCGISLVKTVVNGPAENGCIDPGAISTITYQFVVTNQGNTALTDVILTDDMLGGEITNRIEAGNGDNTLDVGESWTFTADYTITPEDITAGEIENQAEVEASANGITVSDLSGTTATTDDKTVVRICNDGALTITKSLTSSSSTVTSSGQVLTYEVRVENTGNQTLTGVVVSDVLDGNTLALVPATGTDATDGILNVGEEWVFTASYTVEQSDIDNKTEIVNTASVTTVTEGVDLPDPAVVRTPVDRSHGITIVKDHNKTPTGGESCVELDVEDVIEYTFVVTNTGNTTLHDIEIIDELEGLSQITSTESGDLAPGLSRTYTATYEISQADIDRGSITNTATVTAESPLGAVEDTDGAAIGSNTVIINICQNASVEVTKEVDEASIAVPGTLTYTITVANTGNVSLTGTSITDVVTQGGATLADLAADLVRTSNVNDDAILDVDETWTYTVTFDAEQSHIDNGQDIVNTFTFDAEELSGDPVSDGAITEILQNANFTATKEADVEQVTKAGDVITYTITVTNTGNVSLANVTVEDPMGNGDDWSNGVYTIASLPVGSAPYEVTYTYIVTEADIEAGIIRNVATVTDPENPEQPETPEEETPVSGFTATKVADVAQVAKAGDEITYTITVTNTGQVDLANVTVEDAMGNGTGWNNGVYTIASLAIGEEVEVTYTHTVTEADIEAGVIRNVATVTDPENPEQPETPEEETPVRGFTATKVADVAQVAKVGDEITYTITVTNTGQVALANVTVEDAMGNGTGWNNGVYTIASLAIGQEVEVTYTHTVTEADIEAGIIRNVATVTDPENPDQPETPEEETPVSGFTATKVADVAQVAKAGDEITYTITVTNTGRVALANVTVEDAMGNGTGWNNGVYTIASLAIGQEVEVTYTHTVTEADIEAGIIRNVATVTDPENPEHPETPEENTPVGGFTATKVADVAQVAKAGDIITYTITVTNTGNVSLANVTVEDAMGNGTGWNNGVYTIVSLAIGEEVEVTYTHTVTEADIEAGIIRNVATVTDPENPDQPETPEEETPVSGFTATKVADVAKVAKAGDEITYTITVTNTGRVALANVTVEDAMGNGTGWNNGVYTIASLAIGEEVEVTYTHTVTEADIEAGVIRNVATVTDPENPEHPETPEENTPVGGFTATKTADKASVGEGEELTYTIEVTNTGNVDYNGITITDAIPTHTSYVAGSATNGGTLVDGVLNWTVNVPFGESRAVSFTVLVGEGLAGVETLRNVATVTGDDPNNPKTPGVETPVDAPDVPAVLAFEAEKEADKEVVVAGSELTYTITVTNTGDLDYDGIRIVDAIPEHTSYIEGSATDGATFADGVLTWTINVPFEESRAVSFTVLVDEALAGATEITNVATVTGEDPDKPENPSVVVTVIPRPIVANDDEAVGIEAYRTGATNVLNVFDNDQLDGVLVTPSAVTLTRVSGDAALTLNPDGSVDVAAGTLPGIYTLTYRICEVANPDNCDDAVVRVTVVPSLLRIPNVFTPNGDGRNDTFEIEGSEGFDRIEVTIVNRWGNEVYRNNNYKNDWNGANLNEGTYYYQIRTHLGSQVGDYTGWVLIKRQ